MTSKEIVNLLVLLVIMGFMVEAVIFSSKGDLSRANHAMLWAILFQLVAMQ